MILLAAICLPLVGALITALAPRVRLCAPLVALIVSILEVGVTVAAVQRMAGMSDGRFLWSPVPYAGAVPLALAIDGMSAPLVMLTALLVVVAVIASWRIEDAPAAHHALLLALESAVMAAFLAYDVILFYIAWEAVLIPMFFLIARWGHEERRKAAMKFFLYTFAGSALMLAGIIVFWVNTQTTVLDGSGVLPLAEQTLVFWLLAAGMLVKVPAIPLHTWLPDAHVQAPTAGSIMLAGVLLKMGGYGLMRVAPMLAPEAFVSALPVLTALGLAGTVHGALVALGQRDLKRLVAYSSVAHMGFVLMGIGAGTPLGFKAAMLAMVSHGFVAGLAFFLVGALYDRTHTREMARFGGLAARVPKWGSAFVLMALASLGLPGLSGFPGEFMAVLETFGRYRWWATVGGIGVLLAATYNLVAIRDVTLGASREEWREVSDLDRGEMLAVALLAAGILALGVAPRIVGDVMDASVTTLAAILGGGA